ncbi:MAG: PASTA domain-containing protein [Chloroherpetonaceae bacterium]|nr:PASTA domain-containing protein [Chloroherpetonaceae bacterium]MDW8437828.1 PASTA domain-containing protein [Chloroherpetonaceae bacterium]
MLKERLTKSFTSPFAVRIYLTIGALVAFAFLLDKVIMPLVVKGGEIVRVPNVIGKTFEEAERILAERNLTAMRGYERYDAKRPLGTIVFQNPTPNSEVKAGRHVYLSINAAKKPNAPMPDLKGRTLGDAKLTLERLGLELQSVDYAVVYKREEEGLVVAQSVPVGAVLKAGTKVSITIGRLPEDAGVKQVDVPDVVGKTLGEAEKILIEAGFSAGEPQYKYSASLIPNTVVSQSPKAGEMAPVGATIRLVVSTLDKEKEKFKEAQEQN